MIYCLAVFKSRTQTYEFIDHMTRSGISARAVNTPAEAHIGCGVSAEFYMGHRGFAQRVINGYGLNGFLGFYRVERKGGRTFTTSV